MHVGGSVARTLLPFCVCVHGHRQTAWAGGAWAAATYGALACMLAGASRGRFLLEREHGLTVWTLLILHELVPVGAIPSNACNDWHSAQSNVYGFVLLVVWCTAPRVLAFGLVFFACAVTVSNRLLPTMSHGYAYGRGKGARLPDEFRACLLARVRFALCLPHRAMPRGILY